MKQRLARYRSSGGYETWERRTDLPLLALALAFLAVLLTPLLAHPTGNGRRVLSLASAVIWCAFAVDYGARLYLAPQRGRFVRSHPLDLLVIVLPVLRPLRALRLLRLLGAGTLLGFANRRAQRTLHARVSAYVAAAVVITIGVAGVAMLDAERGAANGNIKTLPDALWWAATTVTTVGYGDRYPTTGLGRGIAVALMLVGIALLGVVTATVAAWFVSHLHDVQKAEERTEATLADVLDELREVRARLDAMGDPS